MKNNPWETRGLWMIDRISGINEF